MNRTHSKRLARSEDARRSRSDWSACVFGLARFPKGGCDSLAGFMESPLPDFFRILFRDHEPVGRVTPCAPRLGTAETARRGLTRPTFRFMGSPFSLVRMHWDHEPTSNPSREGRRTAWRVPLLGRVRGGFIAGIDRFMTRSIDEHEFIAVQNEPAKVGETVFLCVRDQTCDFLTRRRPVERKFASPLNAVF